MRRFDKGGDEFYDQISALHKSVRGSNPDAALYWMCRMLDGGADPLYIARRLIRAAVEDIGLADPHALRIALDASETYERLGSPEGELALAQATLYLACAPKSNAAYAAYNKTRSFIGSDKSRRVPEHLRNAPTRLMKELGFGRNYRYAHDDPEAYAAGENYFPEGMPEVRFYEPTQRGLESEISREIGPLARTGQAGERKNMTDPIAALPKTAGFMRLFSWALLIGVRMLDIQLLRSDPGHVARLLATRGYVFPEAEFSALEVERKRLQTSTQEMQARRNAASKQIGNAKARGENVSPLLQEVASLGDELKEAEAQLDRVQDALQHLLLQIPNLPHSSVPDRQQRG